MRFPIKPSVEPIICVVEPILRPLSISPCAILVVRGVYNPAARLVVFISFLYVETMTVSLFDG